MFNPVNITSTRPAPDTNDTTAAGAISTAMGELFEPQTNQMIGINQFVRTTVVSG